MDPTEQTEQRKTRCSEHSRRISDDDLWQRLSEAGDVSRCLRNPKLLLKITSHFSKPEPNPREKHIHINAFMSSILKGKRRRKREEKNSGKKFIDTGRFYAFLTFLHLMSHSSCYQSEKCTIILYNSFSIGKKPFTLRDACPTVLEVVLARVLTFSFSD